MTTRKRRIKRRYQPVERNIREVFNVYNDGSESSAGFQVRVGGDDHGIWPNKTQARAERDKAKGEDLRGQRVRPGAGRVLLREVMETWLAGSQVVGAKPLTAAGYDRLARKRLLPLHETPVRLINKAAVKDFIASLKNEKNGEPLTAATVGHILFVLKCVMEEAVDRGFVAANPCHGVKKPASKKKPLTILGHSQVEALIAATPAPWGLLVELAAHSGLRAGELAGLRVRHFNRLRRCVSVEETVYDNIKRAVGTDGKFKPGQPKSDAGRRLVDELPRDLCDRIADVTEGWPADAYLFGGNGLPYKHEDFAFAPSDKPYSHNRFYRQVFLPTVRGLGLGCRFHDLRHHHASALLEVESNLVYIAQRLGHADPTLLLRTYGHPLEGQGVGLADRLAAQREASKVRRIG